MLSDFAAGSSTPAISAPLPRRAVDTQGRLPSIGDDHEETITKRERAAPFASQRISRRSDGDDSLHTLTRRHHDFKIAGEIADDEKRSAAAAIASRAATAAGVDPRSPPAASLLAEAEAAARAGQ